MDREMEVQHLAEADRLIQDAKDNIARVAALVAAAIERGEEALEGQAALATMKAALDTFNVQRVRILETIADIDAGKYSRP